jgi:hypothetical protein
MPDDLPEFSTAQTPSRQPAVSESCATVARMVTVDDVRAIALSLPRAYEALVADRVKFRVGQIVFLSLSRDESVLGFAFPREERVALVASDPDTFLMPVKSDERYNWVRLRLAAIDATQLREIIEDAWRMVVPKRVAAEHLGDQRGGPPR